MASAPRMARAGVSPAAAIADGGIFERRGGGAEQRGAERAAFEIFVR